MNHDHMQELARSRAREILTNNQSFLSLPVADQKSMYLQVVDEQMNQLVGESGLAADLARRTPKASDQIDDDRHEKGFEDGVDAFEDLVDSVDFPAFVRDLLKSVFDANIDVMKAQTDDYIRLMKEATTGLAKFIKQIDDTTTFAYLAEKSPDQFNMIMESGADGSDKMVLTDPKGEKMDVEDNEVKAQIMKAKIEMAQEHRAALREMILMGVTRMTVDKGVVEAEVNFEFKGTREARRSDRAVMNSSKTTNSGGSFGAKFKRFSIGGNRNVNKTQTRFNVSTANSKNTDELKAKLRGLVNIEFKTDYFKLDNFAQMYAPPTAEEKQAALPQGNG
ncbi:MAG: hypothetical protein AAFP19_20285 [Bacteroidota bacterium]